MWAKFAQSVSQDGNQPNGTSSGRILLLPTRDAGLLPPHRSAAFRRRRLVLHCGVGRFRGVLEPPRFYSLKAALLCGGGGVKMRPPAQRREFGFCLCVVLCSC